MQIHTIHIRPRITRISQMISLILKLCIPLCYAVVSISCTQAEMMYRQVVSGQGLVYIRPDRSIHALPAQRYYFYNQDGITPCLSVGCDGYGNFSGTLSEGTYHVIASNATAMNAVYSGMDSHNTAMVYANNLISAPASRQSARNAMVLGDVYSVVLEILHISAGDTLTLTPIPNLLTRRVTLNFSMDDELKDRVTALSGALQGVYPSVYLFSGETSEEEISRAPDLQIGYEASPDGNDSGVWTATITTFGLYDPKHGENYRNIMVVSIDLIDADQTLVYVDLTDVLSDIMEKHEGVIPIDIPLELEIELTLHDIGVIGIVKPWTDGSGGNAQIPIPIE